MSPASLPSRERKPPRWRVVQAAITAIEKNLGGRQLGDPCRAELIRYENISDGETAGCGFRSRVAIPYETPRGFGNFVTACVVDDAVDLWPKVAEAIGR